MSCDYTKSSTDTLFPGKQYKKSKRKRRRNKLKYSNTRIKKKYHKKFQSGHFYGSAKSNMSQFVDGSGPSSGGVTSNWYWSNYKKALEWQDKHKIAHWKSCALALQEENRYLLEIIKNIQPGLCPKLSVTPQNLNKKLNTNRMSMKFKSDNVDNDIDDNEEVEEEEEEEEEEEVSDEIEFEMSEEMIQFFEESFKHKMALEKLKKETQESKDTEEEVKQIQATRIKRSTEMQSLYGDQASMITGMETAVQLSFEKYCDTKSPKYWPNIPFRL